MKEEHPACQAQKCPNKVENKDYFSFPTPCFNFFPNGYDLLGVDNGDICIWAEPFVISVSCRWKQLMGEITCVSSH